MSINVEPWAERAERLVDVAVGHYRSQQKPAELYEFGCLMYGMAYRDGLEVGTYSGGTTWYLAELGFTMTAVDTDLSHLLIKRPDVDYYQATSWTWARNPTDSFDFILVDASHLEVDVNRDWEAFRPLVREGGVIAFHDICVHDSARGHSEVDRFWSAVGSKQDHTLEIVHEPTDWGGIGVVFL